MRALLLAVAMSNVMGTFWDCSNRAEPVFQVPVIFNVVEFSLKNWDYFSANVSVVNDELANRYR